MQHCVFGVKTLLQLYLAIWRISGRRQLVLIALSVMIAALAAVPLEYQKKIVNGLTDKTLDTRGLVLLAAGMMGFILLSLGLKWASGFRSGILGEDVIRLIRNRLYSDNLRKSSGDRVQTGTLATAISAEAEELGKFAGGAISEPVLQIGTLISVIGYIASTQPMLGAIALLMIVPQTAVVLFTQKRVNEFVAERVRVLRRATNRVTQSDLTEAQQGVLDDFDRIYETRRKMFLWKLSSKFVISAINGAGSVGVLLLGGWLVLEGRSDVGTVVAATMGLTRIQGPSAFLIAFYRQVSANRVKFELLRALIIPPEGQAAQR